MAIHIASVYSIDDRTVADLLGMLGQLPPRRGKKRFCGTLSFSVQQKKPYAGPGRFRICPIYFLTRWCKKARMPVFSFIGFTFGHVCSLALQPLFRYFCCTFVAVMFRLVVPAEWSVTKATLNTLQRILGDFYLFSKTSKDLNLSFRPELNLNAKLRFLTNAEINFEDCIRCVGMCKLR